MKNIFAGFALWRKEKGHSKLMDALRTRIIFSCVFGVIVFGTVTYRLCDIMVIRNAKTVINTEPSNTSPEAHLKEDIVDRNGEILATCLTTASCYCDPTIVIDVDETAKKLSKIKGMPGIDKIKQKIGDSNKHFAWLLRHVAPTTQQKIMDLGLPGILFQKDYRRIYTHGSLFSHIVGGVDIDGDGIYGIEKQFNDKLRSRKIVLTVDLRVQAIVHSELKKAIKRFHAIGGNAVVMGINGEVISMVSFPDFDPNHIRSEDVNNMFNRNTLGAYEPGSTFKILNTAIALENGRASLQSMYDATTPIRIGRFSIDDFKGKRRMLSLAEAFVFSSNIAAVKISQQFGTRIQKEYMKKFGVLDKCSIEIPEVGSPIIPKDWREASSMTISYGYGISVSPLQILSSVASVIGDGNKVYPTLLLSNSNFHEREKIVSEKTTKIMRDLMRATVCFGTAKKAGIPGIEIFGKTGTAYKKVGRGYGSNANRSRITTFIGGFPKRDPKYVMIVMLDDPKPIEGTHGYATAGWNAAPAARDIFERIIPMLCTDSEVDTENENLSVTRYLKLN
jgi:cell division protein FtsI (penicillin-binding protein 3)